MIDILLVPAVIPAGRSTAVELRIRNTGIQVYRNIVLRFVEPREMALDRGRRELTIDALEPGSHADHPLMVTGLRPGHHRIGIRNLSYVDGSHQARRCHGRTVHLDVREPEATQPPVTAPPTRPTRTPGPPGPGDALAGARAREDMHDPMTRETLEQDLLARLDAWTGGSTNVPVALRQLGRSTDLAPIVVRARRLECLGYLVITGADAAGWESASVSLTVDGLRALRRSTTIYAQGDVVMNKEQYSVSGVANVVGKNKLENSLNDSFNKVDGGGTDLGRALREVEAGIRAAELDPDGREHALTQLEMLTGEAAEPNPDPQRLKSFWTSIVAVVPGIVQLAKAADDITALFRPGM